MSPSVKNALKLALFLLAFWSAAADADVKLRIYLKDGTVQAGNLVSEDKEKFVLVTKEGRVEVVKTNIMFVNGKTLAQWNDRPDKTYSTEILPSEVPDRAFINDKAALPPPVKLPPVTKSVMPPPPPVVKEKPVAETPAVTPAEAGVQAVNQQKVENLDSGLRRNDVPTEPKSTKQATAYVPPTAKPVKRQREKKPSFAKARSPEATKEGRPDLTSAKPVIARAPRGKFDREAFAVNHYNLAEYYFAQGERGRAVQELHIAHTLNKWDEKTARALGVFYKEEGIHPRARKYLDLPALRKKPEIRAMVLEMAKLDQRRERMPWILWGGVAFGVTLSFVSVAMLRKLSRKAPEPIVVTAENIDEFVTEPPVEVPLIEEPVAPPPPPPPPPVVAPPPKPLEEIIPLHVIKPDLPAPEPVKLEPVTPEPVKPPVPEPIPLPVLQPVIQRFVEKTARVVAEAIQKGNQLALEGQVELAGREYRTAAALDTGNLDAQLGLAYLCFIQDQWEMSMQHYLNALQINLDSAEAHYGLGRVLAEMNRIEEAIHEVRKAIALDPTLFDAQETLTALGKLA